VSSQIKTHEGAPRWHWLEFAKEVQNTKWRDDLASHIREIALAPKETTETIDYCFPNSYHSPLETTDYHPPDIPLFKETGTKDGIPFAELADWTKSRKP